MNATTWHDSRLCGCKAHGGPEARRIALEARRQAGVRQMLNPQDALRLRVVAQDALSAALLADRDLPDVDYAAGAGY
jgi:hypothetical protein